MQLEHSSVRRGGVTSQYWYGGTQQVTAAIGQGGIDFGFTLPSKGGGETQIQLTVGIEDLRALLMKLADENVSFANTFAECTQVAVAKLLQAHNP